MDSLLAGTLILPWRVHCAGVMSSAAVPVAEHSGHRESHSGLGRKPFAFPPESLFAFSPESCSSSPRNRFHVRPGILFALPRNPQTSEKHFRSLDSVWKTDRKSRFPRRRNCRNYDRTVAVVLPAKLYRG